MGHPMIMGRKTFESIGKALPGSTSIIITRDITYQATDCLVTHSLEQAIAQAKQIDPEAAFVIGGAEIYQQAIPFTDTIYLTEVQHSFAGDTFFQQSTNRFGER